MFYLYKKVINGKAKEFTINKLTITSEIFAKEYANMIGAEFLGLTDEKAEYEIDLIDSTSKTLEKETPILKYFTFEHLPEPLRTVSQPFCELAYYIASKLKRSPEKSVALRKLLEAKDAAVRAAL